MTEEKLSIEDISTFCKKKGFIFPTAEIYGGLSGFWDFGPLGVELKNNLKSEWWKTHVQMRDEIVGIDGSIITNPKVWHASGHVSSFGDLLTECNKCHERFRADHIIEDETGIMADGLSSEEMFKIIQEKNIKCPSCKSDELTKPKAFNLLFKTSIGSVEGEKSTAYLRGETAQVIFADFKNILDTSRLKLPFGIAQIGKAFRNEISPRDFIFRCREFSQMEIEYFIHPEKYNDCPFIEEVLDHQIYMLSTDLQEKNQEAKKISIKEALDKNIIKTHWHAYWLAKCHLWFTNLGANPDNFRIRQHNKDELAHYSSDCWDLEYNFPFGYKELQGVSDRGNYDLTAHGKFLKKDLSIFDEESKQKILPHVIAEPSLGIERAFLVFLCDAYNNDKERGNIVLHLNPKLAPIKVAVFPLVNKEGIPEIAKQIHTTLKQEFTSQYDKSGSVGRRYARADENGIPYCITVDFESKENNTVTIRDRDTTKQKRVDIEDIPTIISDLIKGKKQF